MQGRVGDLEVPGVGRAEALGEVRPVPGQQLVGHPVVQCARARRERRRRGAAGVAFDDLVVRGDDLGAVARVELVAVVEGRVVARGHHDARGRAQGLHAVGHERGGQWPGHLVDHDARAEQHRNDLVVEGLRSPSGVASDDNTPRGLGTDLGEPRDHSLGRASHGEPVHPGRARHHRAAQPRRSEGERRGEAALELRFVTVVEQRLELGAVIGVGVQSDPTQHLFGQRRVHRTGMTRASSAPRKAAADWPASSTSR